MSFASRGKLLYIVVLRSAMPTKKYIRPMTLLDSLTAVVTDPQGTMDHLLTERDNPPYLIFCLSALGLTIALPVLVYQYKYNFVPVESNIRNSFLVAITVGLIFFALIEIVFLRIIGVTSSTLRILAAVVYSLVPIVPIFIAYYISSYYVTRHFSIAYYFATGKRANGDWYLSFFPYFWRFANLCTLLVFANALRVIGPMGLLSGLLVASISGALVVGSLFLGVITGNAFFPDTYLLVWKWIFSFGTVPA